MKLPRITQWLVFLFVICLPFTTSAGKFPQVLLDTVAAAKQATPVVTLDQLKAAIDDPDVWIIDVREPNEYASGHLRNAVNIPRGVIEFKIWKEVGYPEDPDMDQKMYLYCAAGARCALATKALRDLGFTEAYRTDLKLKEWAEAGNELVK
jgi:rhodanese-related sulfurtransferase